MHYHVVLASIPHRPLIIATYAITYTSAGGNTKIRTMLIAINAVLQHDGMAMRIKEVVLAKTGTSRIAKAIMMMTITNGELKVTMINVDDETMVIDDDVTRVARLPSGSTTRTPVQESRPKPQRPLVVILFIFLIIS